MNQSTRKLQRQAIQQGKFATERLREAMFKVNRAAGFIQEISQEEFVARRNKHCSNAYRFRTVAKGSDPLTKAQIKNLFKS